MSVVHAMMHEPPTFEFTEEVIMGVRHGDAYYELPRHEFPARKYSDYSKLKRTIRPNSADDDYLTFEQDVVGDAPINSVTVFIHEDEVEDLIVYLMYWKQWRAEHAEAG